MFSALTLIISHQELQEDGQVAGGEGHQEGAQAAVDDLDAGPALCTVLAWLGQGPDGLQGAVDHHHGGQQEAQQQHTDDQRGAPALLGELVEAAELLVSSLPEVVDGRADGYYHQHPHHYAEAQGCTRGPPALGFERVTDRHPPVHRYAHDGVDAAVYPSKVQTLQDGAERVEACLPVVTDGVHFEGQREEQEDVHQSQAGHVDGGLDPLLQGEAEDVQRHDVEKQAGNEYGDVDDELQVLHHLVRRVGGTVLCHGAAVWLDLGSSVTCSVGWTFVLLFEVFAVSVGAVATKLIRILSTVKTHTARRCIPVSSNQCLRVSARIHKLELLHCHQ